MTTKLIWDFTQLHLQYIFKKTVPLNSVLFSKKIHRYIFLIGLCGLAWGMMMGAVPTSLPQLVLLGNFLAEGNFKIKWQRLKNNRVFWAASSVFWIYLIGLSYSSNLHEGWNDVQIKIPLGWLPVILFSAEPLSKKEWQFALYCFLVGCFGNTAWCVFYSFVLHHAEAGREASRFMSHIRLGLYLNMAVACCVYFANQFSRLGIKTFFSLLALYFVAMMFVLGLASGLFILFVLFFVALGMFVYKQQFWIKISAGIIFLVSAIIIGNYVLQIKNAQLSVKQTEYNQVQHQSQTSGRELIYLDTLGQKENGNQVWINLQMEELQNEWKRKFPKDSFSFKPQHNTTRFDILVRYLASKGLNKDSAGIAALSEKDFQNIQNNIPNYQYGEWNFLHRRIYELVNDYDGFVHQRWVNGHSLTMRIYFWKAAFHTIKQNSLLGVGTGDMKQALNATYDEINSPLSQEWRIRPHNQFLSITLSLGIIGLLIFLFGIIYPAYALRKNLPKLFWAFLCIALLSFFPEDTLDTQAGVTFYAFFNTLFLSLGFFDTEARKHGGTET